MNKLILATEQGIVTCEREGNDWHETSRNTKDKHSRLYNYTMEEIKLKVPRRKLADFCRKNRIRKLAFFGSVLRDDFKPTSDVDVLVEFKKGYTPGLAFFAMPEELKKILGREVDLLTYQGVKASKNPIRRKAILDSAKVYYVAR